MSESIASLASTLTWFRVTLRETRVRIPARGQFCPSFSILNCFLSYIPLYYRNTKYMQNTAKVNLKKSVYIKKCEKNLLYF